jgi:hypothetical protein
VSPDYPCVGLDFRATMPPDFTYPEFELHLASELVLCIPGAQGPGAQGSRAGGGVEGRCSGGGL